MGNSNIVHEFARAINDHDIKKLFALMAENHRFIDAHGKEVIGRDKMKAGWQGYFQWFPDYKIEMEEIFEKGDTVTAFGFASATFQGKSSTKGNYWRIPAAWRAIVSDSRILLWQVYADTKIPYDIIEQNG